MKIPKIKTIHRIYIVAVGAIGFIVAGTVWFILPTLEKSERVYTSIQSKVAEILDLQEAGSTPNLLNAQIFSNMQQLEKLEEGILQKGKEVEFIKFIEGLSKLHGVEQQVSLSKSTTGASLPFLAVSIKLRGNILDLVKYIVSLESSPYYIDIATFDFKTEKIRTTKRVPVVRHLFLDEEGEETPIELFEDVEDYLTEATAQIQARVFTQ